MPRVFMQCSLVGVAGFAALLPPLHEAIAKVAMADCAMATPTDVSYALIGAKLGIAALLLGVVFFAQLRRRPGSFADRFASRRGRRCAVIAAATVGAGLAAFDLCTNFHGADLSVHGQCYCWVTGLLVALVTLISAALSAASSVVLAATRRIIIRVLAFFIRADRLRQIIRHTAFRPTFFTKPRAVVARAFAGRAPPFYA